MSCGICSYHIPWPSFSISPLPRDICWWDSLEAQTVKRLPAMRETPVRSPDLEDPLEKEMQPTPVLLPRKFHGWRSLVGYSPWGHKELDMTEWLFTFHRDICTHLLSLGLDTCILTPCVLAGRTESFPLPIGWWSLGASLGLLFFLEWSWCCWL